MHEDPRSENGSDFLAVVQRFDHVIIRHNCFAVVHRRYAGKTDAAGNVISPLSIIPQWRLHYLAKETHKFSADRGFLRGINDILGASVLISLTQKLAPRDNIDQGIQDGLIRCNVFEEHGYFDKRTKKSDLQRPVAIMREKVDPDSDWMQIANVTIPGWDASLRPAAWSVLDLKLRPERWLGGQNPGGELRKESQVRATNIGLLVVSKGLLQAQKKELLPAIQFGKLTIVDRPAFDDVYEIRAAMQNYLSTFRKEVRPLCLAMFGAPGGGKNFAVRELAKSLGNGSSGLSVLLGGSTGQSHLML